MEPKEVVTDEVKDMDEESKSDEILDETEVDEEIDPEPEEKDYDDTNHNP